METIQRPSFPDILCRYNHTEQCSQDFATHCLLTSPTGNRLFGYVCDAHAAKAIASGNFTKVIDITEKGR